MARVQVRHAAIMDLDEFSLLAQLTVGVLSHHAAACANFIGATCSRTRKWARRPTISKSEFVTDPLGLAKEMTSAWMSRGNSSHHTTGANDHRPGSQALPAPSLEASQYPM
jgi:hypothetical protein